MVPKITFVIIAFAVALTCGQVDEVPQPKGSTVTPSTPTTHATTPSTKPTTSTVTTTTSSTTTKPTTTSTKPTTPPTEPTTNPPTTDYPHPTTPTPTSTPKPSPTTPTPKPSPKPPQKPDVGKWNVTDHNTSVTCIVVDMAIQLNISYIGINNTRNHSLVNVPKDATANGTCGNSTQILYLEWKENNKSFGNLTLEFLKNETTEHFVISRINLTVVADAAVFPDINKNTSHIDLFSNKSEFSTPISKSYRCEKEQSFVLKNVDGKNVTDSEMLVSHVQLEAFYLKKDGKFGAAEDCEPSSSTDIVPIAVGCALVGLVAIVLIAYLVGRRRSQARGYLSM